MRLKQLDGENRRDVTRVDYVYGFSKKSIATQSLFPSVNIQNPIGVDFPLPLSQKLLDTLRKAGEWTVSGFWAEAVGREKVSAEMAAHSRALSGFRHILTAVSTTSNSP